MLREIKSAEKGADLARRWFADEFFELIVWLDEDASVKGFQLCYDRGHRERALTWTEANGLRHEAVDDGEGSPLKNQAPLFRNADESDRGEIVRRFQSASALLPAAIGDFVRHRLTEDRG